MSEAVAPYAFAQSLTVCIDFRNPHAYLAIAPTRALEARLRLSVDWLPFHAPLLLPPRAARADDDRGTRHRRIRSEYFASDLERYAASRGLSLGSIYRSPDCTRASLGILWTRRIAKDHTSRYIETVFERLWVDDADIAGAAVVDRILTELDIPNSGFERWVHDAGMTELAETQAQLESAGLFNVPAYVVEGEVFYGRQHLPMIEWLLTGKAGEVPI